MKKTLIIAAVVALGLSLAACGGGGTPATPPVVTVVVKQPKPTVKTKTVTTQAPTPTSAPAPVNPYANGRDCGSGVYAGPNTSCPFAFNTRDAYDQAPGMTASVQVWSPITGRYYVMDCAPAGSAITCSGGNAASVTFSY